ncbi:MAG: type II secretion system F family protein [Stackebrandtia sp.]
MSACRRLRLLLPRVAGNVAGRDRRRRRLAAVGLGVLTAIAVGGVIGVVVGAATACAVHVAVGRAMPADVRRARERAASDLPFAVDVFATCLRSGAPASQAAAGAAAAVEPGLAEKFRRASRATALGVPPAEAFAELDDVPGASRLISAVAHSERTGASLADGMGLLVDELREDRRQAAEAAAQRAGVWMVLPLCLCFLPAFVLAGLVPVVAATLTQVLNTY